MRRDDDPATRADVESASVAAAESAAAPRPGPLKWLTDAFKQAVDNQRGDAGQLATWLPYSAYSEDDQLFVNDETIGFALEMLPQSGADERMTEVLNSLYATCPAGSSVQTTMLASPYVLPVLRRYAALRPNDADAAAQALQWGRPARNRNIFRSLARRRVSFYLRGSQRSIAKGFHYTVRDFRLVISVSVPGGLDNMSRREELLALRESMGTTLQAAGFPSRIMDATALVGWVANLVNPHRMMEPHPATKRYDNTLELRDQIVEFDTAQDAQPEALVFRKPGRQDIQARFYSVKQYPERFALWNMTGLVGDMMQPALQYPCTFMVTLGVHVLDPAEVRGAVAANHARAVQNAGSQMARIMPDAGKKLQDWAAAANILDAGGSLVSMYHSVGIFTSTERAVPSEEATRAVWRARGFELNNDMYLHRQSLLANLPMSLSPKLHGDLKRLRRVTRKTTANAVHMAPMIAEWAGTRTPTMILGGRRGQVMGFDLYDNDQGNYNAAVIGTSGSGKSVFLNELAWSYRSIDSQVRIMDLGRSFEKLCVRAGGQFVEFNTRSNICVNPFSVVRDINTDMAMLAPVIAKMASQNRPLEELQYKAISSAVMRLWKEYGNDLTMTAVQQLLKSGSLPDLEIHNDSRLRDLAVMLEPYTASGQFSRFFEGRSTIEFSNDFLVIENEELKRSPELNTVVNMILLYQITQDMYLSRERGDHRKKILMIDELMQQLGEGSADDSVKARVIEEAARRARKYGGSLITATQGADDYYSSKQMEAAFQFSDWVFLLRQKPESIDLLDSRRRIAMDDYKKRLLKSLRTEAGAFSELYVFSPIGEGVGRLILDPYTLLMFSNKAEDNAAIDARRKAGMSIDDAIADVLQERGLIS
ncbi:MAG: type IV secretion system protein TraC [Aquabacterium sp.]|nr:type IV secretion system protein TraC [Aquabacterium sp.]